MEHDKSVEISTNFQYQASLHKRRVPLSEHFLATVMGGLILTAHTNAYLFCPYSSCTYNSHINTAKMKVFLRTLGAFSILMWLVQQVSNCQPWVSQPHTFSARLLFDETVAQSFFIFVNRPIVALSVFYCIL